MEVTGRRAQGVVSNGWRNWGHGGAFTGTSTDLGKRARWEPGPSLRQTKSNQCPGGGGHNQGNAPITSSPRSVSPVAKFRACIKDSREILSQNQC